MPIEDQSLNTFIRSHAKLTGTKVMCREGGCGACIVTVGRTHPATKQYESFALNSVRIVEIVSLEVIQFISKHIQCLKPLYACDGMDITTVEGLGDRRRGYHPLQLRLDECAGTQCGYCTPGMIMNMHGLMAMGGPLSMSRIEKSFAGNMCRCTGYRPILDAFKSFARDAPSDLVEKCTVSLIDLLLLNYINKSFILG